MSAPDRSTRRIKSENGSTHVIDVPPTPASSRSPVPLEDKSVRLVPEQQQALDLILRRHNLFLTGPAGCGKSLVMKAAEAGLRDMDLRVRVVAPTGMAAYGVGGTTIHSLFGLDPKTMEFPINKLLDLAREGPLQKRLEVIDVLMLEEVSMVENMLFSKLCRMMQVAKDNEDDAFGGIQVVCCGDFKQLPPVLPWATCWRHGGKTLKRKAGQMRKCPICVLPDGEEYITEQWAFCSAAWDALSFININLQQNHRQNDPTFKDILDRRGNGKAASQKDRDLLYNRHRRIEGAVMIAATKEEVHNENERTFGRLHTRQIDYKCLDNFTMIRGHEEFFSDYHDLSTDRRTLKALLGHRYDTLVQLKSNMRVILITNLDVEKGLVNGSQGEVVAFEPYNEANLPGSRSGFDQSDLLPNTQPGQPRTPDIQLRGGSNHVYRVERMRDFMATTNPSVDLPVVQFDHGVRKTIYPDCSVTELGDEKPYSLLSRTQIPLIQGNAMTIHKAQGITVDKIVVDLTKVFIPGQSYVALSRVRAMDGMKVIGPQSALDRHGADPQVMEFMRRTDWY